MRFIPTEKTIPSSSIYIYFIFFFFIPANPLFAQLKITSALIKQDTTETEIFTEDSLYIAAASVDIAPERQPKSGNLAMLLSAVLPGSGQIYAHRYYTIPLIWGFGYYFTSEWIKADNTYRDFRSRYRESIPLDTVNHIGNLSLKDKRDEWRNYRDGFAFYLILTYLLNIIDAYVGAVLYDFDVSDNLGSSAAIRFRIPFR